MLKMKIWSWWRGMWEMRAWLRLLSKSYLLEGGVWREVDILEVGVLIVAAQRSLLLACRLKLVQCVRLLKILFTIFHPDFRYSCSKPAAVQFLLSPSSPVFLRVAWLSTKNKSDCQCTWGRPFSGPPATRGCAKALQPLRHRRPLLTPGGCWS